MGKRFVDPIWIRQRMDRKEARINREIQRKVYTPPPPEPAFEETDTGPLCSICRRPGRHNHPCE
jgi:hypothetical protein